MAEKSEKTLRHIAFIMDGNGRWATKRGLPREAGHKAGAEVFKTVSEYCVDIGIPVVTVYAFSTENWKRPKREVDAIFRLFSQYIEEAFDRFLEKDLVIRFIGDRTPFPKSMTDRMEELERITADRKNTLNIAINYGGRDEIKRAVNKLIAEGKTEITEADIEAKLDTTGEPMPDMIVRTGAEQRISNFLTWQSAYAELYFTDTLWPDFGKEDVDKAVEEFYRRNRRFGGV